MFTKRISAIALFAVTSPAWAVPFAPVDGRSFAMGGTGVANARASSSGLFNPAMLAAQKPSADFSIILPTVGVIADDSGNVLDTLSDMQDGSLTQFEDAMTAWDNNQTLANATLVANAAGAVKNDLPKLNNKPVTLDIGAGFGFGVPSKTFGFGLHTTMNASVGVVTRIHPNDLTILSNMQAAAATNFAGCDASFQECAPGPNFGELKDPAKILQSSEEAVGVAVGEVGLGFAHQFDIAGQKISLGITPKFVQIDTIQYHESMGSNEDISDVIEDTKYRKEYTDFNADLGAAMTFGEEETATVVGLVVRNVMAKSYKTAGFVDSHGTVWPAYEIELNTQMRAGVAKRWNSFNVAADVDLTKNSGVGLNKDSQFLAVGGEMDFRFIQLRAGYRHNLVSDGVKSMATAGIGLGPLDISAMYADEHSYGANIQFGFSF